MSWFSCITGFEEMGYAATQSLLSTDGEYLVSARSPKRYRIGRFETPSLAELRHGASTQQPHKPASIRFRTIAADAGDLHRDPANQHALFQVASQFNALEMIDPSVTPEDGVTRYATDKTQGPACAIAAGAATIYRNYLLPLGEGTGQTEARQVDCLHDLGLAVGNDQGDLWRMQNGYALCADSGLRRIDKLLSEASEAERRSLQGLLRIALHWDVEVTSSQVPVVVSQAFCSALPVSYSHVPAPRWERFARFILEAAYEATLHAAIVNHARTGCPTVYLTRLGGGAFGNADEWIHAAIQKTLEAFPESGLDVCLVSYGRVLPEYKAMER